MTFLEAAARARTLLIGGGILPRTATLDADLLARHALGWDLATWLAHRRETADERFIERYQHLIERRLTREPVAYIRGLQEFWGRDFLVTPAVLIPRPETELLVELGNRFLSERPRRVVVDVGTGSGCIAVTLALENPDAEVYATDVSAPALDVARDNAQRLGAADVRFVLGSMLDDVPRPIDLVVSNPPYVAERDKPGLSREVREHEPGVALFGGDDGWREIRTLLRQAAPALTADGLLLMEMGYGQSERMRTEIDAVGDLVLDGIAEDLQGIPRVAQVRRA